MTLSIIMPVLDEAATIEAALASLAPYRRRGVELIVVDGGSQDDTVALAQLQADAVLTGLNDFVCFCSHKKGMDIRSVLITLFQFEHLVNREVIVKGE